MNLHQRDCELTALGRIIIQIKTYRQVQTDQVRITRKSNLDTYLRDHLSPLDWELWLSVHVTPTPYEQE